MIEPFGYFDPSSNTNCRRTRLARKGAAAVPDHFLSFCDFFDSMSRASRRRLARRLLFTKFDS